jgi:glycerophosphoryl diester phosphodiesterase
VAPGSELGAIGNRLADAPCDMVELDVLSYRDELFVAHDVRDLTFHAVISLDDALEALAEHLPPGLGMNLDLKSTGYERAVVHTLRYYDLLDRTLVSTMEVESLPRLRALAPELRVGWSVPKARRDYLAHKLTTPFAYAALAYYRRVLPGRTVRQLCKGDVDTIMAHWGVVTPRLWDAISSVGGELYVWTVDDQDRLLALQQLGVTGVVTNHLELFDRA